MPQVVTLNQQLNFGAPNAPYGTRTAVGLSTTNATAVIPLGLWLVEGTTNVAVEFTDDSGSNWRAHFATGAGGLVWSDGFNFRVRSTSGNVTPNRSLVKMAY